MLKMKSIYWNVTEVVNGHTFEHRVLLEEKHMWGHENLPHALPQKMLASPANGTFQNIDREGNLKYYTWSME